MIKDFVMAAFPWVCIGLSLALVFANRKKLGELNRMTTGMCLGVSIGVAMGAACGNMAVGSGAGLLIGMLWGLFMERKS